MRKKLSKIGRLILVFLLGVVILLFVAGSAWQAVAGRAETRQYLPPGRLVDVGGYRLHIYCTGERQADRPTVILEGGAPEWSLHWQKVQPELAKSARVCSYDRAGYGWSEPGPQPRTVKNMTGELHTLLANAGESGPYLLVAHSLWGPLAQLYQHTYPTEVTGMVLIETWSADLFAPMPEPIAQTLPIAQAMKVLAPFGIPRLLGETGVLPLADLLQAGLLPEDLRPVYRAQYYSPNFWATYYAEYAMMEEDAQELKDLTGLGSLPLVVIEAGKRAEDDYPSDAVWDQTLRQEAALSSNGRLVLAADTGHFVQLEAPQLVIEEIQNLLGGD
jgi:pimeloyl-ACP methyl ester carboxylesterase